MLTHFVLDSRPLVGDRCFDIPATAGWAIKKPVVILHSITDYRERP
jgi:hypothetical protein